MHTATLCARLPRSPTPSGRCWLGTAFTEYPEGMDVVEAAFAERSEMPPRKIRVTAFGNRVQEAGAGVVALGGLYVDPIGAMRRATLQR